MFSFSSFERSIRAYVTERLRKNDGWVTCHSPLLIRNKLIPNISNRFDEGGRLSFDFGAKPADVHVHRARAAVVLIPPHFVEQHFPREHGAVV